MPRWTAHLALATLATLIVTAVPRPSSPEPAAAMGTTARLAAGGTRLPAAKHPRVVVLGIDGFDPDLLRKAVEERPDLMPNFKRLIEEGDGVFDLGTSNPPQSPVAWSNFITGRNPGGHGVYDFIHRDPKTYGPAPSTVTLPTGDPTNLPFGFVLPPSGGGDSNRTGTAFWTWLGEQGVPADVYRMPINFPVEEGDGLSFPGMMTPAIDSSYGEFTFYSTSPPPVVSEKVIQVSERGDQIRGAFLLGPTHPLKPSDGRGKIPLEIYLDHDANAAVIDTGTKALVLEPGEWSGFVPVTFDFGIAGGTMGGIVRFYLRSISPEFELYASPINVDPYAPPAPVSYPDDASAELADAIGYYYTQGMAEDVNALKREILTDNEFMQQSELVFQGREEMLDFALDRYTANEDGGLLYFYYSTVDLSGHMMWRHSDPEHPDHDPEIAAQDSSWWSGRDTTWSSVIADLYYKMDPVLGRIRERVGDDTTIIVMSDHGFAPYHREFSLNTWLLEEGYLVLNEGFEKQKPDDAADFSKVSLSGKGRLDDSEDLTPFVDWSRSKAYGVGFNGLYLNIKGREAEGIVEPGADAEALAREIAMKLEALRDPERGNAQVVLRCYLPEQAYSGERLAEAPDLVVGYNSGYGNSDPSSEGYIPHNILQDNLGGTFNGSHLMDPSVVSGTLLTNARVTLEDPRLEDVTASLFQLFSVPAPESIDGRPGME